MWTFVEVRQPEALSPARTAPCTQQTHGKHHRTGTETTPICSQEIKLKSYHTLLDEKLMGGRVPVRSLERNDLLDMASFSKAFTGIASLAAL